MGILDGTYHMRVVGYVTPIFLETMSSIGMLECVYTARGISIGYKNLLIPLLLLPLPHFLLLLPLHPLVLLLLVRDPHHHHVPHLATLTRLLVLLHHSGGFKGVLPRSQSTWGFVYLLGHLSLSDNHIRG